MTVGELLEQLEQPENEAHIQYLAHFKHFENFERFKELSGVKGVFARVIMRFVRKHMDAIMALSECKTAADIAAFKQTGHYKKVKNATIGDMNIEQLKELEHLENLEQLENLKNI